MHLTPAQAADPKLGALQVEQDADRMAHLALELADMKKAGLVVLMFAVAQVQAEDVGARLVQLLDHLRVRAGRSQSRDYLRLAVTPHRILSAFS